ncbi:HCL245Wp [Eremothecium sinecaudum]|uniref:2-(3-amino-3-carboxypropyl)histidine synthase subunit 2 n=1 Tax=Eremothecium sinecaudum TaxID=45286 RepID=A0A109UWJ8_9SACH|nr:HCL245Wp [Eremothecium sinecaudum]AMD19906.1 HCL245Wp [Eremothecium sinecaudum]
MSEAVLVPPALSTHQEEEEFTYQRVEASLYNRSSYLGPTDNATDNEIKAKLSSYYAVPELIEFFKLHPEYKKITLQFPDHLVLDSSIIAQLLQDALVDKECLTTTDGSDKSTENSSCQCKVATQCEKGSTGKHSRQIWVLADTSYSLCCVDEVAAEHVGADIVVHFGDACLNAVQKLPVVYSFGIPYANLSAIVEQFRLTYPEKDSAVCLMADTPYSYHLRSLFEQLKSKGYVNLLYSDIDESAIYEAATVVGHEVNTSGVKNIASWANRSIYADESAEIESTGDELAADYDLFHITVPQDPRWLFLTTKFKSVTVYDPSNNSIIEGQVPSLMRRYRYMHVARTATTIGILINTLSLRNTTKLMDTLVKLIKDNGKKHYMFVVGKPNVAKLANFETIDVWCILGCSQSGIILDQNNEYYKPIITPYELTLALSPELSWSNNWVADFENVIKNIQAAEQDSPVQETSSQSDLQDESDAPEFDVVTGNLVSNSRPLRNIHHLGLEAPLPAVKGSDSSELVKKFSGSLAIKNTISTSAAQLQSRTWSGLGSDYQDDNYDQSGASLEEGIAGVARGYYHEKPKE